MCASQLLCKRFWDGIASSSKTFPALSGIISELSTPWQTCYLFTTSSCPGWHSSVDVIIRSPGCFLTPCLWHFENSYFIFSQLKMVPFIYHSEEQRTWNLWSNLSTYLSTLAPGVRWALPSWQDKHWDWGSWCWWELMVGFLFFYPWQVRKQIVQVGIRSEYRL